MNSDTEFGDDELTAVVKAADLRTPRSRRGVFHLLIDVQGTEMGRVRVLNGFEVLLGRSADAGIWIGDDGVSRRHARLLLGAQTYAIEDLQSANGTFVQGVRVVGRRSLNEGDQIQVGPTALFRYTVTDEDQKALLEQLYSTSVTDALTGARNREYLDTLLVSELSFAKRHKLDLCFVIFDLDHFKKVNDTYGHPAGDAVLVAVADAVRGEMRREDQLCRYGGEEFAVVLRDIDKAGAVTMAERIRAMVASLKVEHEGRPIRVTTSLGVASIKELEDATTRALIKLADARLYRAKQSGRNRVVSGD